MNVRTPQAQLQAARELLGVTPAEARDQSVLKRAYRRHLVAHSPDRDPEGFRAIRAAYELLTSPVGPMCAALERVVPGVPLPQASTEVLPAVSGATALAILRAVVAGMQTSDLLPGSRP